MTVVLYMLAGLVIGTVSGVIGIGGGVMLVPLFIFAFKMDMYTAVGTSLAVIVPSALAATISHASKGHVDLSPVLWLAIGAILGALLSGQIIHFISPLWLRRGFACFLIFMAAKLFLK